MFRYNESKLCHDALKFLLERIFKQTRFKSKMEHGGGLLDKRYSGDVKVENWVYTYDRRKETAFLLISQ